MDRRLRNGVEDHESKTDRPPVMELGELQRIKSMQGMGDIAPWFGWSLVFLLIRVAL